MRSHLLASLTSKVAIGVTATVLAAGSAGAVIATQTISDDSVHAAEATTTTSSTSTTLAPTTTSTTSTTLAPTTTTTVEDDEAHEHPDNFGDAVSEDAHDGGVDGDEISDAAHAKNEARKAESDDDDEADDHGKSDDEEHGKSAEHRQDDDED